MILKFYIGGFFRNSFDLGLTGQQLTCYEYDNALFKETQEPLVVNIKHNVLWLKLIEHLKQCKWQKTYNSDVLDGTQWNLKFRSDDFSIDAQGSNKYPTGFKTMLKMLNKITGMDMNV
jgi:hypothetical protein